MDTAPDDQAARLDAELTPIDWTVLPPGSERDTVAVPSGSLARVSLGPAEGESGQRRIELRSAWSSCPA